MVEYLAEDTATCESCKYWECINSTTHNDMGQCHRYPKMADVGVMLDFLKKEEAKNLPSRPGDVGVAMPWLTTANGWCWAFPMMMRTDFCGEWKNRD